MKIQNALFVILSVKLNVIMIDLWYFMLAQYAEGINWGIHFI